MNSLRTSMVAMAFMLLAGCNNNPASGSYLGTVTDPPYRDEGPWPYRYTLSQTDGVWSGSVEHRGSNGWVFLDSMHISEQNQSRIAFKITDESGLRSGWYLLLKDVSAKGFSGVLVWDLQPGDRARGLWFSPAIPEPNGAANRGQPVRSETNPTSSAAGPGR
jgi:hypothetical protein